VPNWICSKAQSNDDFMDSGSSSIVELGRFMTGFFVVMGIGTLVFTILEGTCGQTRGTCRS
jgi:hypothetical protein